MINWARCTSVAASLLSAIAVALVGFGQTRNPASSTTATDSAKATQTDDLDIDFDNALLVWERNNGKVTLRSHDRDSTAPVTDPPKCTELRKPCPRKSSGKIAPLALFDGWSLQERVKGTELHFEITGPRQGRIQILADDSDALVKPDVSWLPWTRGTWEFSVVGTGDEIARLQISEANVIEKREGDPNIQQVSPITSPGDSCWVEVPCPAPKKK